MACKPMPLRLPRWLLIWTVALLIAGPAPSRAGPEDDRLRVVKFFKDRYPDIRADDYSLGSLAFDPDAKAQYDAIMQFPPFLADIEKGEQLWHATLKSGKTYADCLPNGGRMLAGNYPQFDDARGRVVTFEDALNDCRVANGEAPYTPGDPDTMGLLTAYARTLSDGMRVNVRVEGAAARAAFEEGKRLFYARAGQLNYSCAQCHIDHAGNRLRAEILSPALGQATHWPVFRGGEDPVTLQTRYADCYRKARHEPDPPGSPRMNNLEYFHTYLSNGLEMKSSVFRK